MGKHDREGWDISEKVYKLLSFVWDHWVANSVSNEGMPQLPAFGCCVTVLISGWAYAVTGLRIGRSFELLTREESGLLVSYEHVTEDMLD